MKTTYPSLLASVLSLLLITGYAGCSDAPGPMTQAVMLSQKKTFIVNGPKDEPFPRQVALAVRDQIQNRGYQYQETSPDFVVHVDWQHSQLNNATNAMPPQTNQPMNSNMVDYVELVISANDGATNQALWHSPVIPSLVAKSITEADATGQARAALKDFPPAQN